MLADCSRRRRHPNTGPCADWLAFAGQTQRPKPIGDPAVVRLHVERFIRSRIVRRSLALGIIALSGWALLPYVTYRVAPSAYVNAELMLVTAPMAGQLASDLPRKGEYFQRAR